MREYVIHAERKAGMPAEGLVVRAADAEAARQIAELYGLVNILVKPREREASGEGDAEEKARHAGV